MDNEESIPTATRVEVIELGLELKDISMVLAGLDQIKVAALEAAAAMASIGARAPGTPKGVIALMREWLADIERGSNLYGMPPLSPRDFISQLSKLEAV